MPSSLICAPPSAGRPLPRTLRAGLERAFDHDFSAIRVHEGPTATRLEARAFACGDQLHFTPGRYRPAEPAGLRLLAHELAHVVQQRAGRAVNPFGSGLAVVDDPALEAEARAWAELVVRGGRVPTGAVAGRFDGAVGVIQCDDDEDDSDLPKNKWRNVKSRHRTEKRVATGLMTAGSVGIQAASLATGTSSIAMAGAIAAGVAVSATGIGLVAAGGALTLGSMAMSAKSAYSTHQHLKVLEQIYEDRGRYRMRCQHLPGADDGLGQFPDIHSFIAEVVLPWVIRQKKHKLGKKVGSAAGGGMLVGAWSAGRNLYKRPRARSASGGRTTPSAWPSTSSRRSVRWSPRS